MKKLRDLVARCVLPAWRLAVLGLLVAIYLKSAETYDEMPGECVSGSDLLESTRDVVSELSDEIHKSEIRSTAWCSSH